MLQDIKLIQRNLLHFYTLSMNHQKPSEKIQKKKSIHSCIKKNKIPRNKSNQEVKDPYTENQRTLMKETEDDTNKWTDKPFTWTRRILLK